MERLADCQQLVDLLIRKVDQLHVRYTMRCSPSVTRHDHTTVLLPTVKMQIQTLTSNAFWGHALGENAYLVHVRSETDQDGVGRDTFLLRNLLRDFVVSEGRSGRPKRGVSRDGDPLRLGEFHKFGLST